MEISVEAAEDEADRLTAEYLMLEKEEADCMSRIREKESTLEADDEEGQIEMMQLNEELRSLRMQKLVLRSRMDAL